jgi:hypothetical protein
MISLLVSLLVSLSDASEVATYLLGKQARACTTHPSAPCCSVPPWTVAEYAWYMAQSGQAHEVDPLVIAAIAWHESKLIADAVGPSGHDVGLLQLVHGYVPESEEELFDPAVNIEAGARVLAWWESRPRYAAHYLAHYAGGVSPEARHYSFETWVLRQVAKHRKQQIPAGLPVFGGAP